MSDFTPDLRDKIIETHTIVKSLQPIIKDHQKRLQKAETNIAIGKAFFGIITLGIPVIIGAIAKKLGI